MTGRAIIIVVVGIIIVAGITLFNVEAASTGIVSNVNMHFSKQVALNIAESGVNMAITKLGIDRTWRTGYTGLHLLNGVTTVTLYDTTFQGIGCVGIRSTATFNKQTATANVFGYFPPKWKPISVKALLTLRASNTVNGNIVLDGRDHDMYGNLISNSGTYGVWTPASSFTISGSAIVGGTVSGVDYAPKDPSKAGFNPAVIALNQPGGYPNTPDSALGGASVGFTEGMSKAIALSGVGGSQYVTDPTQLRFPLSGITYVELPSGGSWSPATINGQGILIVHNADKTASIKNIQSSFTGLVLADDIVHLQGTVIGAVMGLSDFPSSGNVVGNGNANLLFSNQAITNATGFLVNGNQLKVVAWWE
jgi:hypothetical protein